MAAENNIVGEVGLIVKPVDPGFNAGVQKIIDKIERDAQFKVAADTQQAQAALQGLDTQIGSVNNGLTQAALNVAGITAAFYALKSATTAVIGKFSGLFDQLAQARAGFASILKSQNAGNTLLADIQEFARVSPFVTQELVNYSQQLLGVGIASQKIIPLLTSVGDIISSVGGDTQNLGRVLFTLTQIQSIGRLAGQDAMQLQSALIPITKYLAEYLGKTTQEVKKLQEQGKISAEQVFAAISAQGENVKGAMANATRNIAGARAILSDTITLLINGNPAMQRIFTDIYQSIQKFANFLGQADVSAAITDFLESIGKLYDGFKPLLSSLAEIGGGSGLSSLRIMTTLLETLGTVISAIPEPAIKVLAAFLTGLATIRAPLLLLKYVSSFQTLTAGVFNASVAVNDYTGKLRQEQAAAEGAAAANRGLAQAQTQVESSAVASSAALTRSQRAKGFLQKNGQMLAGIGLASAGAVVSDGNNGERDAVGSVLTYGGMGAAFGGPIGAIGGAGVGAFLAIANASKKAAEEIKKNAQEAADAWAQKVGFDLKNQFGDITSTKGLEQFFKTADRGTLVMSNLTDAQKGWQAEVDKFKQNGIFTENDLSRFNKLEDLLGKTKDVMARLKQEQDALFALPEIQDYLGPIADKLAILNDNRPGEIVPNAQGVVGADVGFLNGQDIPRTTDEYIRLSTRLKDTWGVTLDDIAKNTTEQISLMIENFTRIPDAVKDAIRVADEWNKRLADGKALADQLYDGQIKQLGAQMSFTSAVTGSLEAQTKATMNLKDSNAQLGAEKELLTLKSQVQSQAFAELNNTVAAAAAAESAYQLALQFRSSASDAALATTRFQTEETITQLLKLAGLTDNLENRQIIIDVATKGVQTVLAEIQTLTEKLIAIQTGAFTANAVVRDFETRYTKDALDDANKKLKDTLNGGSDNDIAKQAKDEEAKRNADARARDAAAKAEAAAREAAAAAERWANAVVTATSSLQGAIQQAGDQIEAAAMTWIGSIKERTQYERGVSVSRLTKNARQQTADVQELTTGLASLRQRGVSQSVIDALGINNVTDIRQLRKLLKSSDSDLATLSQSVGSLNSAAVSLAQKEEDKRTRTNITQAIIDAAKTLGMDVSKGQAASISNQFTITPGTNAEDIALQILNILTSGKVSR